MPMFEGRTSDGNRIDLQVSDDGTLLSSPTMEASVGDSVADMNAQATRVVACGDVPSAYPDSGNPVKVGMRAKSSLTSSTPCKDGNRVDWYASEDGAAYTRSIPANPADYINATPTTITSSTSDASIVNAGGSGLRVYITDVIVTNKSATGTRVSLKDGSGGTVKAILPAAANYGGIAHHFDPPLRGSANTAWHAACADSVDSVYVTVTGYKSKI